MAASLSSASKVMAWQDRRYSHAYEVGRLLVGTSPDGDSITDHVLYGVYVAGGGLVYVGQTGDAKRRLRDLPVGESHHLATTIPPEVWERVIVVHWPSLLKRISADERHTAERLELTTCGLAMEYRLQVAYRPVMMTRRRSTKGGWSARNIDSSRSRGAVASLQLPELFSLVRERWDALTRVQWSGSGDPVVYFSAGRAVFPGALLLGRADSVVYRKLSQC
jgi:hypothetical protein